jgi:hypothetical protein
MPRLTDERLWADVARIRVELSKQDCSCLGISEREGTFFGSGRLIGRNLVLTARHVLESERGIALPSDGWEVRLLRDQVNGNRAGEPVPAKVVWRSQAPLDLALLQLSGVERSPKIQLRFGQYNSVMKDLDGVWIAGFPRAAREKKDVAKEYSAPAKIRKADKGSLYWLTIASANAPKDGVDWSGCSGANVLIRRGDDVWLLGVVQQLPKAFGATSLQVAPIVAALADPDFKSHIKECGSVGSFGISENRSLPEDRLHADDLEKLPGPYESIGYHAYWASRRTFDKNADKPFFGRDKDIEKLDAAFKSDRGVILLRAEAGMGKSTLAARWADHCAGKADTTVLRHAFSVHEPEAATRVSMVQNLVRQVAFSLGQEELGEGEPGEASQLAGRLGACLGHDRPDGTRLVVVLDALDEAAEPIDPWSAPLGRGVYILATCRAEAGETPRVLDNWRERCNEDHTLVAEHVLLPLDAPAIAAWLSAAEGKIFATTDPLITRALEASEGIPLFATFLIPHAIEELRAGAIDPFPANFAEYARQRLKDLEGRPDATQTEGWSWQKVLDLFALLTVAKAPLPRNWLQGFSEARLDRLDQRVDRWLWRRAESLRMNRREDILDA